MNAAQRQQRQQERWQMMTQFERELQARGVTRIAGIDEAGRGALAGPVTAAAVILPPDFYLPELNDSKQLSPAQRQKLEPIIKEQAVAWACAHVNHRIIDRINILEAARLAMQRAVAKLTVAPEYLLLDAMTLPLSLPQQSLIKGDARSVSIAAASVIAKTARDRLMEQLDPLFPQYGFAQHKAYPTALHKERLREFGPSAIHRRTFRY